MAHNIAIIGGASGWGAPVHGAEKGPAVLCNAGLVDLLKAHGASCYWEETIFPSVREEEISRPVLPNEAMELVREHADRVCASVKKVMSRGDFPWVVGGDHSIAVGTWSGVVASLGAAQHFGLIWLDAHLDGHIPQTSPSMAYHGMSLAILLGYGDTSLCSMGGNGVKLSPQHVTVIGVRSYEDEEHALLTQLGVRIVMMEEVRQRGFKVVLEEAMICANSGTAGFGISLDIDFFDPAFSLSTGTPVEGGPKPDEVLPYLHLAAEHPNFKAFELVEYNPELGNAELTKELIFSVCKAFAHCNQEAMTHA